MDRCLGEWDRTWEDLGAESRAGYRSTCLTDWESIRADLEARQIPDAEARCEDATVELDALTCDELAVLYF